MNISNHAYKRYCQRILGINNSDAEIKGYIEAHKDELTDAILAMVTLSDFVYSGAINGFDPANFYIYQDTLFVCNADNSAIMTIVKVNYGFGVVIDSQIVASLRQELDALNGQLKEAERIKADKLESKQVELGYVQADIEAVKSKLLSLEAKEGSVKAEIRSINSGVEAVKKEIERVAYKLCYSIDYKTDLLVKKK